MDEQESFDSTQDKQEVNQIVPTPLSPQSSHNKLIIGIVAVLVLVVAGAAGAYFFLQPETEPIDGIFPPDDTTGKWVKAVFPSDYKHSVEIWHPNNWTFSCCLDTDVRSDHLIFPSDPKDGQSFVIRISDYALIDPSKGTIDSPVRLSPEEKVELLRQKWSPNTSELNRIKVNNFETEAYVFEASGGGKIHPLYPEIQFYARGTVQPSRKIYLINTGDGVTSATFENYEQFSKEFIAEFLNRLEPVPAGVGTFFKFID